MARVEMSPQLLKRVNALSENLETELERKLLGYSATVVNETPVQTGALVNSWSFKDIKNRKGQRAKSSHGKPIAPNKETQRAKSLSNLMKDVKVAIQDASPDGIYEYRNGAPHAPSVGRRVENKIVTVIKGKQTNG